MIRRPMSEEDNGTGSPQEGMKSTAFMATAACLKPLIARLI